jgi:hypothetical protein
MLAIKYKQLGAVPKRQALLVFQLEWLGDHMTAIRCPICDSFLESDGEAALTIILRSHLDTVHDLRPTRDVLSSGTLEHQPQNWEGMKRGTIPVEQEVGEDVEESILCPFCGDRFFGHDGEELTQDLISHFRDAHGIKMPGRVFSGIR